MKLYLHLVLLAFIFLCAVNCAPSDRRNKKVKVNGDKPSRDEKLFTRQLKALSKLGCRPSKCKVPIKTLLNSTSTIHDMELVYPQVVVIKKCKESCSYCKLDQDDFGIESRVCKMKKSKTKTVVVKFFDPDTSEWKYEHVKTEEDKKCECMEKDEIWDQVS